MTWHSRMHRRKRVAATSSTSAAMRGADVLAALPHRDAEPIDIDSARADVAEAANRIWADGCRHRPPRICSYGLASHHRWDEVADRCLTCGNCTMVCPTCFCTSVEDVTDLTGPARGTMDGLGVVLRARLHHVHEGPVRKSVPSRYRHWLTHKLGTWHDQFGSSGCVGCGRCIAWCPTGIDITEEMNALDLLARQRIPPTMPEAAADDVLRCDDPVPYRVRSRVAENRDSATLCLEPVRQSLPAPQPGEFMLMMYAFGIGERVAISGQRSAVRVRRSDQTYDSLGRRREQSSARFTARHRHRHARGPFGTHWGLDRQSATTSSSLRAGWVWLRYGLWSSRRSTTVTDSGG